MCTHKFSTRFAMSPAFVPGKKVQWGSFTLSAHPGDPTGTIPSSYSVTQVEWVTTDELWRMIGTETADDDSSLSLDHLRYPQRSQALLANLAPLWALPPIERPLETFTVRFYGRTETGMQRMNAVRDVCARFGPFEPAPAKYAEWAPSLDVLQFLQEMDALLGAFDRERPFAPWDVRRKIEKVQKKMLGLDEPEVPLKPLDWLPLDLPALHGAVGDGRPGSSGRQSVETVSRPLGSACLVDELVVVAPCL